MPILNNLFSPALIGSSGNYEGSYGASWITGNPSYLFDDSGNGVSAAGFRIGSASVASYLYLRFNVTGNSDIVINKLNILCQFMVFSGYSSSRQMRVDFFRGNTLISRQYVDTTTGLRNYELTSFYDQQDGIYKSIVLNPTRIEIYLYHYPFSSGSDLSYNLFIQHLDIIGEFGKPESWFGFYQAKIMGGGAIGDKRYFILTPSINGMTELLRIAGPEGQIMNVLLTDDINNPLNSGYSINTPNGIRYLCSTQYPGDI
jgi:hypothetical protein